MRADPLWRVPRLLWRMRKVPGSVIEPITSVIELHKLRVRTVLLRKYSTKREIQTFESRKEIITNTTDIFEYENAVFSFRTKNFDFAPLKTRGQTPFCI